MPVSIEALGIDRLSVGERLELIEKIWDSLPEEVAPEKSRSGIWLSWPGAVLPPNPSQSWANPGEKFSRCCTALGILQSGNLALDLPLLVADE